MALSFATRLLRWYRKSGRILPWRGVHDPYQIWVSEVMLQQTQVETVLPYYARWLAAFPTIGALAAAPQQAVLAQWEGLGYYSRARNFHRAAQKVVTEFGGQVPNTVEALRSLPGVGPYTAAAIASLAFGRDVAVLDGNVKRVLARVYDFQADVKSGRGEKYLWALAQRLLPKGAAGDYNQALMDLGATVCTPRAPACEVCPVQTTCQAYKLGVQLERPIKITKAPTPHKQLIAAVIHKREQVLLVQRPADELLGGLWAFPTVMRGNDLDEATHLRTALQATFKVTVTVGAQRQIVQHAYSHFKVTVAVFDCQWQSGHPPTHQWVTLTHLNDYPMGKVDRQIARALT